MDTVIAIYAMAVLGFLFRVLAPYVLEKWETGEEWDWKYIGGQLVGQIVGILSLYGLGLDMALAGLQGVGLLGAFAYGYFATDLGNLARKANDVRKA